MEWLVAIVRHCMATYHAWDGDRRLPEFAACRLIGIQVLFRAWFAGCGQLAGFLGTGGYRRGGWLDRKSRAFDTSGPACPQAMWTISEQRCG
jgi:hypothetical protein